MPDSERVEYPAGAVETPAHVALRRAKRQALALLLVVTAVFVATSLVERGLLLNCIKAMAEAAMVGALADWFAVVALFRRPLGLPIPHTAVIARNQERIGRNLGSFVRDKFLDVPSLVALIRRHDPAERLSQWLLAPGNAALLGQQTKRVGRIGAELGHAIGKVGAVPEAFSRLGLAGKPAQVQRLDEDDDPRGQRHEQQQHGDAFGDDIAL